MLRPDGVRVIMDAEDNHHRNVVLAGRDRQPSHPHNGDLMLSLG
ncbi:hypothetical protein [Kocuria rosea]|nr:hypothetical protein [Kocuria rosea]WIG17603.1 hypothetical protein QOY29_01350 [Kocuria rosea]